MNTIENFFRDLPLSGTIALLALVWLGVCLFVSRLGGWSRLAEVYPALGGFDGKKLRLQTIILARGVRYGNSVTVGASRQGLYLAPLFPFRPGHPPILVPWYEISVSEKRGFWAHGTEMKFMRVPGVSLKVSPAVGRHLRQEAGEAWPEEGGRYFASIAPDEGALQESRDAGGAVEVRPARRPKGRAGRSRGKWFPPAGRT